MAATVTKVHTSVKHICISQLSTVMYLELYILQHYVFIVDEPAGILWKEAH